LAITGVLRDLIVSQEKSGRSLGSTARHFRGVSLPAIMPVVAFFTTLTAHAEIAARASQVAAQLVHDVLFTTVDTTIRFGAMLEGAEALRLVLANVVMTLLVRVATLLPWISAGGGGTERDEGCRECKKFHRNLREDKAAARATR
jgi:carbon starvation protein CstA